VRLWVALPMNRRGRKVEIGEIYPAPGARKKASYGLGAAYVDMSEYAQAEEILLGTVEENPEAEVAWLSLGQIYLEQGKTYDAIDALYKALDGKGGAAKPIPDAQCTTTWACAIRRRATSRPRAESSFRSSRAA